MKLDSEFLKAVLVLLVRDREFLRAFGDRLTQDDFTPADGSIEGRDIWLVAGVALSHWKRFREGIGRLLVSEMDKHGRLAKLGEKRMIGLRRLCHWILESPIENVRAITARIEELKQASAVQTALDEVLRLHAAGELSSQKFLEIARQVVSNDGSAPPKPVDYFETLEDRIERRRMHDVASRYPVLFIDPFDAMVRAIARGHLGCVAAPYKRGKSMFLIWVAVAYIMQRLNVLYVTLEDPKEDVEDRFDATITHLPLDHLRDKERVLRKRMARFRSIVRGRLRIYDGTETMVTVADLENLVLQQREEGFIVDALIVDYDDELRPARKYNERRFELAEIYRDLRRLASRYDMLVWTAAQTQRGTDDRKVLTGDVLAEDISKARKVMLLVSLGAGEYGEDSLHLYVAAHKNDRQRIGCDIFSDRSRMLIYDRRRTLRELARRSSEGTDGVS